MPIRIALDAFRADQARVVDRVHWSPAGSLEPEGLDAAGLRIRLSGLTLPLTDVVVGADGALYFSVGGRGTQSELFRVTYVGGEYSSPTE